VEQDGPRRGVSERRLLWALSWVSGKFGHEGDVILDGLDWLAADTGCTPSAVGQC
jgi:hypothetical protein